MLGPLERRVPLHDGARVLVASVHLVCCGRAGDERDQRRVVEVEAIRDALASMRPAESGAPLVILGDLNLVGSTRPLDRLRTALDVDGSDLSTAPAMRLDGRSNLTWSKATASFTPGRLDYVVYTDAALELVEARVGARRAAR